MIRAATSTLARRSLKYSSSVKGIPRLGGVVPDNVQQFHATSLKQEEKKEDAVVEKAPTMMPGWWDPAYTVPVVFSFAIPAIHYDWVTINEETQLAGVIIGFCAVVYSQAGDMIRNALVEKGDQILKEHNELEDAVIESLETMHEELKVSENIITDMEDIRKATEDTYAKLNAAGAIKPKYDFKAQMERILHAIQQEETNVTEKAKVALMEEATKSVEEQFATSKQLKKAALDVAIAKIKGTAQPGDDPVQAAFVKFFQDKAASVTAADDAAEAAAQRASLVAKVNSIAKNEGYYFEFDESGQPKMAV